jgi:hypothetical protein
MKSFLTKNLTRFVEVCQTNAAEECKGMEVREMFNPFDYPRLILVGSFLFFWAAAWIGRSLHRHMQAPDHEELRFVLGGTLTLLGLIIGFTFSMSVTRYDQRKNYEEQEANAIGTEYVRADLLPAADAAKVRTLLKNYLDQRIVEYETRNREELRQIDARTARLQNEMWSTVTAPATAQPTPIAALVVAGMNDVLNSQGYTQAAWWNRIPTAAWILMIIISIFCNLLLGFGSHEKKAVVLLILPVALAISLLLISDIDSPRSGLIHVRPQNLESLAESFHSQ